jgi:hypothetical protein
MRERAIQHGGPVSGIARVRIFEGHEHTITRSDGETEPSLPREAKSQVSIGLDEIATLSLPQLLAKLDTAAREIGASQAKHLFETVSEAVEKTGNKIDARGERISSNLVLEALEKIEIDFRDDGTPMLPTLYIGPDLEEAMKKVSAEANESPAVKKRFDQIIARKKEAWRAREASRKLVG